MHGDRLALLSRNNWQYVVVTYVTYAATRLGVVLVPINFMLKAQEVAYILDYSPPPQVGQDRETMDI